MRDGERMVLVFVPTAQIDRVDASGSQAIIHVGARSYTIRERMARLEQLLPAEQFARVHRSAS